MGIDTRLKIKSFNSDANSAHDMDSNESTIYLGANNNGKTTYEFGLTLNKTNGTYEAIIELGVPTALNRSAALNQLSDWMKRAASTIDGAIKNGDL